MYDPKPSAVSIWVIQVVAREESRGSHEAVAAGSLCPKRIWMAFWF